VPASGTLPDIFNLLHSQHRLADTVWNWAFYASVALIAIALFKRFPYRHFFKTHRLMAIVYLALVFHGVVLMNPAYWRSPLGPAIGLLFFVAMLAAAVSLLRRVGRTRRAVGTIVDLTYYRENRVLGVTIKLKDRSFGHVAGQFAFVSFDPAEEPHPFTISSAWHDDGKLSFHIKGIGDYTKNFSQTRKVGDVITGLMANSILAVTSRDRSGLPVASASPHFLHVCRQVYCIRISAMSTCSTAPMRRMKTSSKK